MEFENLTCRTSSVNDIRNFRKETIEKQEQHRFVIVAGHMENEVIQKSKFVQINDKRFYFSYGNVSLPFSPPNLKSLINYKDKKGQKN